MGVTIAAGVLAGLVGVNFGLPKVIYRGLIGLQRKLAGLRTLRLADTGIGPGVGPTKGEGAGGR